MVYKDESMGARGNIRVEVYLNSQDVANNTSSIHVRGRIRCDSGSSSSDSTGNCKAQISGSYDYGPITANFDVGDSWETEISRDFTVTHAADGTKSVTETFTFGPTITSNFGSSKDSVSVSYTLPQIIRMPSAPGTPSLAWAAPNTITMSYAAASDNGSAILEYQVQYGTDPAQVAFTDAPSAGTSLSKAIGGLAIGTTYYFRVRARNAQGWGPWSANSSFYIPTVPSQVVTRSVVFNAPNSMTISWSTPASNGGAAIDSYAVRYSTVNNASTGTTLWGVGYSPVTVNGLANNTTYYIWIFPHNSQGYGQESAVMTVVVPDVPGTPAAPTLAYDIPSTVTATFVAPSNGGSAIIEHEIQWSENAAFSPATSVISTSPKVFSISPGRTYWYRVRSRNAQGWGPYSAAANVFTYAGPRIWYGGVWRDTVCYVKYGGVWRVAIPYIKRNGVWKIIGSL